MGIRQTEQSLPWLKRLMCYLSAHFGTSGNGLIRKVSRRLRTLVRNPIHPDDWIEDVCLAISDRMKPQASQLSIVDEMFPLLRVAFRIAEYNAYLDHFAHAHVYSTGRSCRFMDDMRSFRSVKEEYLRHYPQYAGRLSHYHGWRVLFPGLAYTLFLNSAFRFLREFERCELPFVFTLYPGGGFFLDDANSDSKIRRLLTSVNFRGVIVTQEISYQYVLSKNWCDPRLVHFIYGGVLPTRQLFDHARPKRHYQMQKATFDVCFVANKYVPRGVDKGYDVFVEVARRFSTMHSDAHFHVVGPYDERDVDVSGLGERIHFYGCQVTDFFPGFHSGMDLILSPNIHSGSQRGVFDGFPTAACAEAALCGVPLFCTDPLRQNTAFRDGEEIVIIPHDAAKICDLIEGYYQDPDLLGSLGRRGQEAFRKVFSYEAQVVPRCNILSALLT